MRGLPLWRSRDGWKMFLTSRMLRLPTDRSSMLFLRGVKSIPVLLPENVVLILNRSWIRVSVVALPVIFCTEGAKIFSLLTLRNRWEKRWGRWKRAGETTWRWLVWSRLVTVTVFAILTNKDVCRDSESTVWMEINFIRRKCLVSNPARCCIGISTRSLNEFLPVSHPKEK